MTNGANTYLAVVGVPANSVYAIQVSDINGSPQSVYDQNAPGYAFRIY